MNPSYFFLGGVKIFADYDNAASILNLCMYYCIPYTRFTPTAEGVEMVIRYSSFKKFKKEADARGIAFTVLNRWGLPALVDRYKLRIGAFVGILIAAVLVIASQSVIWDIDVVGNETITTSQIRQLLREEGFFVGCYIPDANTDKIETRILLKSDVISWMSINIKGTVAEVQVRENVKPQEDDAPKKPANLVASKEGIIEEVRVFRGTITVSPGQPVGKGALLVSGIYQGERVGVMYTRASGQVFARTKSEYYIEIPFQYEGKHYTGEEYYDNYLIFFDYLINISKNSGKDGALYDKIDIVENFCLPGGVETPFGIKTVKYAAYETVTLTRTAEEAEELAYFELSRRLGEDATDGIIVSKTITPILKEDSFAILCKIEIIEDIAAVSEFEVDIVD